MKTRLLPPLPVILAFAFWLAAFPCHARGAERPNVLLIMTDQQFGDAMSCRMGERYLRTPAMDSLAQRGMVFTRAYSANPLCMPLRNSLFTGRYPHETGVTSNDYRPLDPAEFVCMGTYFRRAGYETAYFGKWHLCFDQKDTSAHGFEQLVTKSKTKDGPDAAAAAGAVEFLSRKHEKPFLLVASFLNPHNICEYARMLGGLPGQVLNCGDVGDPPPPDQWPPAPANLAPPQNEPDGMTMMRRGYHASRLFPVGNFTVDDWRRDRWAYYRMIEKVDAEIGKVLAALRQAGLEDNTLVVFTSDHGDCAGAHGFNQKTVFYEESVRVPLIVTFKNKTAVGLSDKLVNTGIDILPTMLDFAGLGVPEKLPGRSLRPLALGQPVAAWRDHVVVENHMVQAGPVGDLTPTMEGRMARTERYKYCVYNRGRQRESLVDLEADPGETKDLATDSRYRDVLASHRELLKRFGREMNDPLVGELLADPGKPMPFVTAGQKKAGKRRQAGAQK